MTDKKNVEDGDWTWFADYGAVMIEWTIHCPGTRKCEVGMGMKILGEPQGERIKFSGTQEFTTVGIGAIHVRVDDGKWICPVQLDQGKVGAVTIIDKPW